MRVAIVALAAITLTASTAAADDDDDESPSPFDTRSTAVFLHSALWSPYGYAGFEAEQAVVPAWTFSAGFGLGDASLQGAAMTHVRFGGGRSRLEIGAGVSYGKRVWKDLCGDDICAQKRGTVLLSNLEIGGAHRWQRGFSMKYYVGYSRVVAGSLTCEAVNVDECVAKRQKEGLTTVYTGFALGASF